MNYEEMSDFELNCLLLPFWAKKEGVEIKSYGKHPALGGICSMVTFTFDCDGYELSHSINFCTDWNAAMELYEMHGLQSHREEHNDGYEWRVRASLSNAAGDKSLLRAIVICLIKVMTAKGW